MCRNDSLAECVHVAYFDDSTAARCDVLPRRVSSSSFPLAGGRLGWGLRLEMAYLTRFKQSTKRKARNLRRDMTDAERMLWQHLRSRQLAGLRFRRQHPVGRYILDFVCLEAGLIIEVDGGQHGIQNSYDEARTAWLEERGYRVLRFWNNEVLANSTGVRDAIWREVESYIQPPS